MILATTKVENYEHFLEIFSTKGAEKRAQHGSKGATVFRDPVEDDRVWVLFDWDADGWKKFVSDPEVPGDPAGSRTHRQATGRGTRRPLRRLTASIRSSGIPQIIGNRTEECTYERVTVR